MEDRRLIVIAFILLTISISIFTTNIDLFKEKVVIDNSGQKITEYWVNPLNRIKITEDKTIYEKDIDTKLIELYVTVLPSNKTKAVTFDEVTNQKVVDSQGAAVADKEDLFAKIYFEIGTPSAIVNLESMPNGYIEIRGQSSRLNFQKSYKIKVTGEENSFLGFQTANLNKHVSDKTRIKNKLAFDFFKTLDDFTSLKTHFVVMRVKDLSKVVPDQYFKSYGLYTFIEQPNKSFLTHHGLDPNGNLYKVEAFEFYKTEDSIKEIDAVGYNENEFERVLEVRGNNEHGKLIQMLEDLNNVSIDINKIVNKYFDKDNLYTWLAVNILFDNADTSSRNYLLYSPLNSKKWFFMPWDYDDIMRTVVEEETWQRGISNYWGVRIFNRMFREEENINELSMKIEEVYNGILDYDIEKKIDEYKEIVDEYVLSQPDSVNFGLTVQQYYEEYEKIKKLLKQTINTIIKPLKTHNHFF